MVVRCPSCLSALPPSATVCPACGVALSDAPTIALDRAASAPTAGLPSRGLHLVVLLGRTRIAEHRFDKPIVSLGRDGIQDVLLDNPSVSRRHCQLRHSPEARGFVVEDLGTPNGTLLNGRRVSAAPLAAGDELGVGKFTVLCNPTPQQLARLDVRPVATGASTTAEDASTTYLDESELARARVALDAERTAHLRPIGAGAERRFVLKETTVLGRGEIADVPLRGWLISARHALIVRDGDRYLIRHAAGLRRVRVNGRPVRERVLGDRDRIAIADNRFQFFPAV